MSVFIFVPMSLYVYDIYMFVNEGTGVLVLYQVLDCLAWQHSDHCVNLRPKLTTAV